MRGAEFLPTKLVLLVILLTSMAAECFAQAGDPAETIRIESDLVDLQVSVLSHDPARLPALLRLTDFTVTEDDVPQEIAFFAAADAPFDLVLLLDLSGSTANKLKLIRRSARRFVEAARPSDRIAILTFTDSVEIVSPLTDKRADLLKAVKDIEEPEGGTKFWDALRYALDGLVRSGQNGRRSAVVVMTDGVDNALPDVFGEGSNTTFEQLLNIAKRSDAVIYPVYLDTEEEAVKHHQTPRSAYELARAQLADLARASGTRMYRANKLNDLENVYEQVIRDLGTVYSIGYRPKVESRDGKWHEVRVSLTNHPELAARTKSGYYAKVSPASN